MRIYLDVCCLNRPFNDQLQNRIRVEAEAVRTILQRVRAGELTWVSSAAVQYEVGRIRNAERRHKIIDLMQAVSEALVVSPAITARSIEVGQQGLSAMDALHLAFAEAGRCDILFTVDDRFLRRAARLQPPTSVDVLNPVAWTVEPEDDH